MNKADDVLIIQISAIAFEGGSDIFGLGDDSKPYWWHTAEGVWKLA